ncbi:hypothetical protein F4778DRAFT_383930 [Xylariomycetidae sp. FL2044]|nr:hypothetical protein F4778DRAFT_383930 [Xylariomycetidae sp. FL2044]
MKPIISPPTRNLCIVYGRKRSTVPSSSPPPQRPSIHPRSQQLPFPGIPDLPQPIPSFPPGPASGSAIRSLPVVVTVGPNIRHLCNRTDILEHLPNTRSTPFGRRLNSEDFIPPRHRRLCRRALSHIFDGLAEYRRSGTPLYVFEKTRDLLIHDHHKPFAEALDMFVGVCNALDSEYGLGCSDALLQQVDEFAIDLMHAHSTGFFNPLRLMAFFRSYSKVFQPTTPRHLDTLRTLWHSVPINYRVHVMRDFAQSLNRMSRRSNVHAMFRAMQDMGMI